MLKIGVLGVGHLGKIHLNCLSMIDELFEVVGFYDPEDTHAAEAVERFGVPRFQDLDQLLDLVDVVDIVTPTITHFELAAKAMRKGKHLFIEKPVTHTLAQAEALIELQRELGLVVQIGHVERFNPALLSLNGLSMRPMFIEAHRLSLFNPRGTDVSVVLDLMIHDLDIVLSVVDSEVVSIHASGVPVVSETPDICNARLEFANGCVANLTASRISLKQMRKVRLFQKDAYISLDLLEKQAQVIRLFDHPTASAAGNGQMLELPTSNGTKWMSVEMPAIEQVNAIKMELETFGQSILQNTPAKVPLADGYEALKLAEWISRDLQERETRFKESGITF
ncbi:MAG: Gfo/Idh/MocA family oxidoreductase [Saprospirales bacterium]|nr:Gfo/Idh/MocA family oxidoreductase [Saprospirales bacterium]